MQTDMNVEMFEQIKALIRAEPTRINMETWVSSTPDNMCGTVGCISGWAQTLETLKNSNAPQTPGFIKTAASKIIERNCSLAYSGTVKIVETNEEAGRRILNITHSTARSIFYVENWPCVFREAMDEGELAPGTPEYAEVVCSVIDYLLEKFPEGINLKNEREWFWQER